MKRAFALTVAVFLFLGCLPALAKDIKLATGEWNPYTSAKMENYGYFTKVVSEVFAEMGHSPKYIFYPWMRCYNSVLIGKVWAAFPYSKTPQREGEVFFSDQISFSVTKWFYYERTGETKNIRYDTLTDLKPYRLGGVTGYFYEENLRKAGLKVDYSPKEINAVEKLMLGRVDFVPLNELVARHLIKTHFPAKAHNFKTLDKPYSKKALRLIVSKKFPEAKILLREFNSALKRCRARGGCKDSFVANR
ncbi:substrate-binding periplasmic protein [Dethiosulfatarculus sandiegensis]|uniref:Uncharacterized protein n=1 Tax=Dethiosulfatarculus sandiegensis TaxID=1429043 RepID=A0A0D2GJH9_9BACT|nr:transporter substrate-binding domain-containing protein [Dethiosulfatarculus sandiegensis]KIX14942.1 hypothetical protein X474_07275 [Dethiosulfatarculus sandiegensis]